MPDGMQLTTEWIRGVEVQIYVTERGRFQAATVDGARLGSGDSLVNVLATVRTNLAKQNVRVSIPFFTKAGERGEATGVHASNGTILARIDGLATQLSGYAELRVLPADMPTEKLDRYTALRDQVSKANAEMKLIEQGFEFDLGGAVKSEVEAKAKAAMASETTG